jgi:ER membrane protein complex subunit 1, C-terminal/PQQ-like domain
MCASPSPLLLCVLVHRLHKNVGEVSDVVWTSFTPQKRSEKQTFLLAGSTAGAVSALNVSDGSVEWRRLLPSQQGRVRRVLAPSSSSSSSSALVYALTHGTRTTPPHLFAMHAQNGLVNWESPLQSEEAAQVLAAPNTRQLSTLRMLPSHSLLLTAVGSAHVCAFDVRARALRWCANSRTLLPARSTLLALASRASSKYVYALVHDDGGDTELARLLRISVQSGQVSEAGVQPPPQAGARDCTLLDSGQRPRLVCVLRSHSVAGEDAQASTSLWVSRVTSSRATSTGEDPAVVEAEVEIALAAGQSVLEVVGGADAALSGDRLQSGVLLRVSSSDDEPASSSSYRYLCAGESGSWRECGRFSSDSIFAVVDGGAALAAVTATAATASTYAASLRVLGEGGVQLYSALLSPREVPHRALFVDWPHSGEARRAHACLLGGDHSLLCGGVLSAPADWTRDEALSQLDANVLYMELPRSQSLTPREAVDMEALLLHPPTPVVAFVRRLRMQIHALVHTLSGSAGEAEATGAEEDGHSLRADRYGFRRLILATNARARTVLALDSLTGAVVWQRYLHAGERAAAVASSAPPLRVVGLHLVRTAAHPPPRLLLVAYDEAAERARTWLLDALNGEVMERRWLPAGFLPQSTVLLPTEVGVDRYRVVLALGEGGADPQLFPESEEARAAVALLVPQLYLHEAVAVGKQARLSGYQLVSQADGRLQAEPRWQMGFAGSPTETLLATEQLTPEQHFGGGPGLPVRVIGNGALGEYPSAHLLAVATQSRVAASVSADSERQSPPERSVSVYVVCAVTGRVLCSARHRNAAGPVRLLLRDGWLLYSYWNLRLHRQELGSLALFDRSLDWEQARRQPGNHSEAERLGVTHLAELDAPTYSAYSLSLPQVVRSSIVSPATVVELHATTSTRGLGGRHALIATASGEVLSLPDQLLDPRRSLPSAAAEGLLPSHGGVLPALGPRFRPTHGVRVARLRHMASSGASVESTSLVVAWGLDVWGSRMAPSRSFDLLKQDFNYVMLIVLTAALIAGIYALRTRTLHSARKQQWK